MKSIFQNTVAIVFAVGCFIAVFIAVGQGLDRPVPVHEHGQIVAFRTPEGVVKKGDPAFDKLIRSWKEEEGR